jgi:NitT/TauT family transport system permease protein
MRILERVLTGLAALMAALATAFEVGAAATAPVAITTGLITLAYLGVVLVVLIVFRRAVPPLLAGLLALAGGVLVIALLDQVQSVGPGYWFLLATVWLLAWLFAERLANRDPHGKGQGVANILIPAMFGATILLAWEAITRGAGVPQVLLPPPSSIWAVLVGSVPTLAVDFVQTFKAVLVGYALGNGAAFVVAIAIDRSPFLKRGLLPLGNFVSALPLIGVAPIMVMWFGFDWPSKAAVVVIMTFFPMLVNTVAGLNASSSIERDMMRTYASSYWQTLFKLRLPAAAPFIFNALKINSTLALIGAIVAEFFGTPIVGMGFRISSEIGKLNVQMVWAEIAVAALAGSVFYWVVALIERAVTFWHPSVRGGRT